MGNTIIDLQNITRESQRFFIDSNEIPGIQTLQIQYDINASTLKFLGGNNPIEIPKGPQVGKASCSTFLISDDTLLSYTGDIGFNGYLIKNTNDFTNNFYFNSGYMTYYHSQCSIGQIPTVDANFDILGDVGYLRIYETSSFLNSDKIANDLNNIMTVTPTGKLKIPSYSNVNISLDGISSSRVLNYDLSINIPRNPIYALGSRYPIAVKINYPIEVSCNFRIELGEYNANQLNNFPLNQNRRNLNINISDFYTNNQILNYSFNQLLLLSENYISNSEGNVILEAKYQKLIGK